MSSHTAHSNLPRVILGKHPSWVTLYDHACRQVEPSPRTFADIVAAVQGQQTAIYHTVQARRAAGNHEDADDLLAQYLNRLGTTPSPMPNWLEIITLIIEQVIGIRVEAAEQRISWRLRHAPPVGLEGLVWGGGHVDLVAECETGGGIVVKINTGQPLALEIETMFTTFSEYVSPGCSHYLLTGLDRTDIRP